MASAAAYTNRRPNTYTHRLCTKQHPPPRAITAVTTTTAPPASCLLAAGAAAMRLSRPPGPPPPLPSAAARRRRASSAPRPTPTASSRTPSPVRFHLFFWTRLVSFPSPLSNRQPPTTIKPRGRAQTLYYLPTQRTKPPSNDNPRQSAPAAVAALRDGGRRGAFRPQACLRLPGPPGVLIYLYVIFVYIYFMHDVYSTGSWSKHVKHKGEGAVTYIHFTIQTHPP